MMKISYHISETADMQQSVLSERILSVLDKPGYVILEKSSETIKFKFNIWQLGSRSQVYGKVDGGRFEMKVEGNKVIINFYYYVSPVLWTLFLGFDVCVGIIKEPQILYGIPFILIFFYLHALIVKSSGIEMMRRILNVT
jgi:hypothetical protein